MTNSDDDKQNKPPKPPDPKKTVSTIDDYKDLAIEMMPSSRKRKFKWRKNER